MEITKVVAEMPEKEITLIFLVKKLNEKYILNVTRDKLALEFQELKQEQMTVTQYDVRFNQLTKYARGSVKEGAEKIKRFVKRLKLGIKSKLVLFG